MGREENSLPFSIFGQEIADDFHLCPDSGCGGMRIYLCGGSYLGNGGIF